MSTEPCCYYWQWCSGFCHGGVEHLRRIRRRGSGAFLTRLPKARGQKWSESSTQKRAGVDENSPKGSFVIQLRSELPIHRSGRLDKSRLGSVRDKSESTKVGWA